MIHVGKTPMLVLFVALGGCSTMSIQSAHDPFARFPETGSYDWVPEPQTMSDDPRVDRAGADARIRKAVESGLAAKGYQKVSSGKPDFLVAYHAAIGSELNAAKTDDRDFSWGYDSDGR